MAQTTELSRSIVEFLNSSEVVKTRRCPSCGAPMEYVPVTFHFAGEAWDVGLPVCIWCEPESLELVDHRRVA